MAFALEFDGADMPEVWGVYINTSACPDGYSGLVYLADSEDKARDHAKEKPCVCRVRKISLVRTSGTEGCRCPKCGATLKPAWAGSVIQCPKCEHVTERYNQTLGQMEPCTVRTELDKVKA